MVKGKAKSNQDSKQTSKKKAAPSKKQKERTLINAWREKIQIAHTELVSKLISHLNKPKVNKPPTVPELEKICYTFPIVCARAKGAREEKPALPDMDSLAKKPSQALRTAMFEAGETFWFKPGTDYQSSLFPSNKNSWNRCDAWLETLRKEAKDELEEENPE